MAGPCPVDTGAGAGGFGGRAGGAFRSEHAEELVRSPVVVPDVQRGTACGLSPLTSRYNPLHGLAMVLARTVDGVRPVDQTWVGLPVDGSWSTRPRGYRRWSGTARCSGLVRDFGHVVPHRVEVPRLVAAAVGPPVDDRCAPQTSTPRLTSSSRPNVFVRCQGAETAVLPLACPAPNASNPAATPAVAGPRRTRPALTSVAPGSFRNPTNHAC